jgi:thioredoxin-related protein
MKAFSFFLLIVLSFGLFGQTEIEYKDSTYENAFERARKEGKLMCIFVYDMDCSHCEIMRNTVLNQQEVYDFLNQNFVNFAVDSKTQEGFEFCKKHKIPSFPTFLFRDSTETDVINFTGEAKANDFLAEAKNALNPKLHQSYLETAFEKDTTNGFACLAYLNSIKRSMQKDKMESVAKRYLDTQKQADLLSVLNWKVMALGVQNMASKEFDFIVKHKAEFIQLTSLKRFEIKVTSMVKKEMKHALDFDLTNEYTTKQAIAKRAGLRSVDSLLYFFDLQFYEKNKSWKKYDEVARKGTQEFAWNSAKILIDIAVNYYKFLPGKISLDFAIKLAKRAVELENVYVTNYLTAKLYKKNNDLNNAKIYAKRAFELVKDSDADKTDIKRLYKELGLK